MKTFILCLCSIHLFCSGKAPFDSHNEKPHIADQWAGFVSGKTIPTEKAPTRNKLKDDPEQQNEHEHVCYQNIASQLQTMKDEIESEPSEKKLEEFELACRVMALHLDTNISQESLEPADEVVQLAARIKLLQDPFWHAIVTNITKKKKTLSPPSFTLDELERDLPTHDLKKDSSINILLKKLEEREILHEDFSKEAFEELATKLNSCKKSPEEILSMLAHLEQPIVTTRVKDAKKATELFNGAVTSEIQAHIKFLPLKRKEDYLILEKTYSVIALLYLKAHDYGHEKGLEEAEKLMKGPIMNKIIDWKQSRGMPDALTEYAEIWFEINKRKYGSSSDGAASSST